VPTEKEKFNFAKPDIQTRFTQILCFFKENKMKATKEFRLSFTDEAKKIVSQMSLEEKIYLMSGRSSLEDNAEAFNHPSADNHYNVYPYPAGGNERLGVPEMRFCDGPRGVVCEKSTCFPVTMARGAAFDPELEEEIGRAIGREIRAYGGNYYGGVCINLPYNPGWGRSQEVYGEDDFHLSAMGIGLLKGIQYQNVIACIKHYAFNSMENGRFVVSVTADKRTEREVYLRHFEECVKAGAASVMSSYNKYQGDYNGMNKYLLTDVLKKEWDFDGFVSSDFMWGTRDTVRAANAGLDVEMCDTHYYGKNLVQAVKEGKVSEGIINDAALRIVRTLLAFAKAPDPEEYPRKVVGCLAHIALAKKAAQKAMTLIKNEHSTLPFSKEKTKTVAVLGKLGNIENIGDHGSSRVFPHYTVTPVAGVAKVLPGAEVIYYDGADSEKAKKIAQEADAVIIVAGYNHNDEGEFIAASGDFEHDQGGDRKESLGLHKNEIEMIKAVAPVNPKTAVVLIGGNMIMIDEWKDVAPAILMAYYPGQEGGTVIAETLFGDNNPGGKLPFVIVKKESDLPRVDWAAEEQVYNYYHGYAKLDKEGVEASVPYGFGLSYTTFEYSGASFEVKNGSVIAKVTVKNTGKVAGDEVAQFYAGFSKSKVDRPVKSLRGFKRVSLKSGESKTVEIACPLDKLAWWNETKWELEKMTYEAYIGSSSADKDLLKGSFTVV
jgi:beta-glucosidase